MVVDSHTECRKLEADNQQLRRERAQDKEALHILEQRIRSQPSREAFRNRKKQPEPARSTKIVQQFDIDNIFAQSRNNGKMIKNYSADEALFEEDSSQYAE